jgi:hypothetical protein
MTKDPPDPMTTPITDKQARAIVVTAMNLAFAINPDAKKTLREDRKDPATAPISNDQVRAIIEASIPMAISAEHDYGERTREACEKFVAALDEAFPGIARKMSEIQRRVYRAWDANTRH